MRPLRALAAAVPLAMACLAPSLFAQGMPEGAEQLLSLTNQARAADGLGPLRWDPALAEAARLQGEQMVEHADLQHRFPGELDVAERAAQAGAHFRAVAENIAIGRDVPTLHREWMQSVQHRTNILDPRMNIMGIALLRRGGEVYAVEDFAQAVENVSQSEVERRVSALLRQQGIAPTAPAQDARQTCEMTHGSAGGTRPGFIMRWESSEMSRLPDVLLQRIATHGYKTAAVGACGSAHPGQPFTTYRVAVLLY